MCGASVSRDVGHDQRGASKAHPVEFLARPTCSNMNRSPPLGPDCRKRQEAQFTLVRDPMPSHTVRYADRLREPDAARCCPMLGDQMGRRPTESDRCCGNKSRRESATTRARRGYSSGAQIQFCSCDEEGMCSRRSRPNAGHVPESSYGRLSLHFCRYEEGITIPLAG
jgi:hypothetical protein